MPSSLFRSLEHVQFTLNGHLFSGWADESEALMIELHTVANYTVGPDGVMAVAGTGHRGGEVTTKTMVNSDSSKFIASLHALIRRGGVVEFSGTLINTVFGENLTLDGGVIIETPHIVSYGNDAPDAYETRFMFEKIEATADSVQSRPLPTPLEITFTGQ